MSRQYRWLLPLALGISDGILNALILAASAMLHGGGQITFTLAYRVAIVAFVTAIFTVFVAEYANLRAGLSRAARQLNFTQSGRLATTQLGREVRKEGLQAALGASLASLFGAATPLAIGALVPAYPWVSLLFAIIALGVLGIALARATSGNPVYWSLGLIACGIVVAAIGAQLRLA